MKEKILSSIKSTLFILYVLGFIFTFSSALPSYIGSSFLAQISTEAMVSIIYAICAICTLATFFYTPKILKRYGNYQTVVWLSVMNTLALFGIAFFHNLYSILFCFIVTCVASTIIAFCFHNTEKMPAPIVP